MKMPSQQPTEQLGEASSRIWIAHKPRREKEDDDWHESDQMEVPRTEDEKLEEILERRRMDGGSLQKSRYLSW